MRLISNEEVFMVAGRGDGRSGFGFGWVTIYQAEDSVSDSTRSTDSGGYCTGVPDQLFGVDRGPACMAHDKNYSSDTSMTRLQADNQFLDDMTAANERDGGGALGSLVNGIYYIGVRIFGGFFYEGKN